jgi:hypothetical protein
MKPKLVFFCVCGNFSRCINASKYDTSPALTPKCPQLHSSTSVSGCYDGSAPALVNPNEHPAVGLPVRVSPSPAAVQTYAPIGVASSVPSHLHSCTATSASFAAPTSDETSRCTCSPFSVCTCHVPMQSVVSHRTTCFSSSSQSNPATVAAAAAVGDIGGSVSVTTFVVDLVD